MNSALDPEVVAKPRGNPKWQKGVSGNPGGLPRGTPRISTSLMKLLRTAPNEVYEPQNKADTIALSLYDSALKGDTWATREILDRCEGKVSQTLQLSAMQLPTHELAERLVQAFMAAGVDESQARSAVLQLAAEND